MLDSPCRAWLFALTFAAVAAPAAAANLLANPEFDDGLGTDDWAASVGSWQLSDDARGCSTSSAYLGDSAVAASDHFLGLYSQQCLEVDGEATPTLHLGALYRSAAEVYVRLYLTLYSDAACSAFAGYSNFAATAAPAGWSWLLGPVSLGPSVRSVRLSADFNPKSAGIAAYEGEFDRFYVGSEPLIFADGFEDDPALCLRWSGGVGLP